MLSTYQYGFGPKRGTMDVVSRLKDIAVGTDCKYVMALLVDIKGAFDSVWWPIIMQTLRDLNVPASLHKIMQSYLSNKEVMMGKP